MPSHSQLNIDHKPLCQVPFYAAACVSNLSKKLFSAFLHVQLSIDLPTSQRLCGDHRSTC